MPFVYAAEGRQTGRLVTEKRLLGQFLTRARQLAAKGDLVVEGQSR